MYYLSETTRFASVGEDTGRGGTGSEMESVESECGLARNVEQIEQALSRGDYEEAARLIEADWQAAWFGFNTSRFLEIMTFLVPQLKTPSRLFTLVHRVITSRKQGELFSRDTTAGIALDEPQQMFLVNLLRMANLRMRGRPVEALEQAEELNTQLGLMQPIYDTREGWALQTAVQIGITAMLAGDFSRAHAQFTQAHLHVMIPNLAFLTRDSLAKSALLHACFGDLDYARQLISQADRVPRTSSWVEKHLDLYRSLIAALTQAESPEASLGMLEDIDLHEIGEIWPFYVVVLYRAMKSANYQDALEARLRTFDSMPLPRTDGQGFSGSVIPLKRALLALQAGRGSEARQLLDRADPALPYTQLIEAVAHLYAGRPVQALHIASGLREATRVHRQMEIRRLAILSAAHNATGDTRSCLDVVQRAMSLPRGLNAADVRQFSPEVRSLAAEHLDGWDDDAAGPSIFLVNLPAPGRALSQREIEVLQHLAEGQPRAEIAKRLFISLNTLKTQLQSIYRKLGVSSATAAMLEADRRGLV